ncbi:hypothetical protein BBEV_2102 [Salisediminibacterium beveridgei]|uniref:Uncharacterized protein n=2 Tax=Salisediminibacterium beveridgei TaxID=632773 RepID=A0A1D7QWT0_9BACI|nr:hypothetical protein BBEV_2102 [Salisediminibacterium beveridgei]
MLVTIFLAGSLLVACTQTGATLNQAQRELPFDVLVADPVPDDWVLMESHFEDDLFIMIFESEEEEGQVEIVQDKNIQGLDLQHLREYVLGLDHTIAPDDQDDEIIEFDDFVGEISLVDGEELTVQLTFVKQDDLTTATSFDIPIYQIVGKNVTAETVLQFAASLTSSQATT